MPAVRVETIQSRIKAVEAQGYVVRCIRADGSLEVAKKDETAKDDDLNLINMSKR